MSGHPLQGQPISADWARGLERTVTRHRVRAGHGLRLTETPNGTIISLAQQPPPSRSVTSSWPYGDQWAFGLEIAGTTVTVYQGGLEVAGAYYAADAASIEITASGQYIGLEFDRDLGALSITGPHSSRPASDAGKYRTPLYSFSLSGGRAVLAREHINDIRLEAIA